MARRLFMAEAISRVPSRVNRPFLGEGGRHGDGSPRSCYEPAPARGRTCPLSGKAYPMFPTKNFSARALIGVGLFAIALASGCNKPKHKTKTAAPAPSGSAAVAAAAAAKGPCQKYAATLCEQAGKESEACQSLTAAAEILSPSACTAGMKDIAFSLKKLGD